MELWCARKIVLLMGVERAVTRWYILRQPIVDEITTLEARLNQLTVQSQEEYVSVDAQQNDIDAVELQLKQAQEHLRALGPCPKPMMG